MDDTFGGYNDNAQFTFSKLWWCPVIILRHLSWGAYGLTSQTLSVLSIELVRMNEPSGDRAIPVTVSVWPGMVYKTELDLRVSQTLTRLSMPALTLEKNKIRMVITIFRTVKTHMQSPKFYNCYKLIQLFRVTCFIAGKYNTEYYGTFIKFFCWLATWGSINGWMNKLKGDLAILLS